MGYASVNGHLSCCASRNSTFPSFFLDWIDTRVSLNNSIFNHLIMLISNLINPTANCSFMASCWGCLLFVTTGRKYKCTLRNMTPVIFVSSICVWYYCAILRIPTLCSLLVKIKLSEWIVNVSWVNRWTFSNSFLARYLLNYPVSKFGRLKPCEKCHSFVRGPIVWVFYTNVHE